MRQARFLRTPLHGSPEKRARRGGVAGISTRPGLGHLRELQDVRTSRRLIYFAEHPIRQPDTLASVPLAVASIERIGTPG
jgi:hypothetical protein